MKFYLYDKDTKEYQGEQLGYIDPLETELSGENVYLTPPYSTDIKPNLSELKDNEIFVFKDNKWQIEQEFYVGKIVDCQSERVSKYVTDKGLTFEKCDEGFKIVEKPAPKEKTLEELKEQKHAELKRIMRARRNAIQVEFDGDTFDANESAQENMIVLLKAFDLGAPAVQIRSATEVTHIFDKDTCQRLSLVMLQAVQALYAEYWWLKNRLAACETIAEVEAITWQEASK